MENNGPTKFTATGMADQTGTDDSKAGSEKLTGVFEALESFGMSSDRVIRLRKSIEDLGVREGVQKAAEYFSEQLSDARDYAKNNKEKVIGGAAGVLVGASLLAMAIRRATNEKGAAGDTKAAARGGRKSAAKRAAGKSSSASRSSKAAKKSAGSSTSSTRKSAASRKPSKASKTPAKRANAPGSKRGTSKSSPRRGR